MGAIWNDCSTVMLLLLHLAFEPCLYYPSLTQLLPFPSPSAPSSISQDQNSSNKYIPTQIFDSRSAGLVYSLQRVPVCTAGKSSLKRASPWCGLGLSCECFMFYCVSFSCLLTWYICRYITLTVLQTLYAYFVEGDTVFVGKRKTFDKRVCISPFLLSFKSNTVFPCISYLLVTCEYARNRSLQNG